MKIISLIKCFQIQWGPFEMEISSFNFSVLTQAYIENMQLTLIHKTNDVLLASPDLYRTG